MAKKKKRQRSEKIILKAVTDETFQKEVIESERPVLVEFGAPWCGPCAAIAPIIEELSVDYEGRVDFVRLELDDNPVMPKKFDVRAIPTLMLFIGGESVGQFVGAVPMFMIVSLVEDKTGLKPMKNPVENDEGKKEIEDGDVQDGEEDGEVDEDDDVAQAGGEDDEDAGDEDAGDDEDV